MRRRMECVPNFGGGRDEAAIGDIAAQVETVGGILLATRGRG